MMKRYKPFPLERIEAIEADVEYMNSVGRSRRHIVQAVAKLNNISPADLCGSSRVRSISHRRWRAFYILRQGGRSYPEVGVLLNKDHTSVMYGVGCVEATLGIVRAGKPLPKRCIRRGFPRPDVPQETYVYWYKSEGKWGVRIKANRQEHHVGYYKDFTEAVAARDAALRSHVEAA